MNGPMISIIIPVYCAEKYLDECLQSIKRQSFTDYEVILVDDHSPDESGNICERYASEDPRFLVIHNETNKGPATARNIALDRARGDYICFIDSDDYVSSDYLSVLYQAVLDNDVKIVMFNHVNFRDGEKITEDIAKKNDTMTIEKYSDDMVKVLEDYEHTERYVSMWAKIYHKSIWSDERFPDGLFSEDTYIFYRLLDKCKEFIYLDATLYLRRLHDSSVTHEGYHMENWNFVDAKCKQLEYFKEKGNQRCVEISFDSVMHYFWWNINEMKNNNMRDDEIVNSYRSRIRKCVRVLKVTDTYSFRNLLRQYYIAFFKKIA